MNTPIEIILVVDTETGGLLHENPALLEIACSPIDKDLNDLPEYCSGIIKPYGDKKVTDGALNVNGISREQIANGRDPREVLNELILYIKSFKKTKTKIVLAGHNFDDFDLPLLVEFFEFFGKDLSEYVNSKFTIDTMWWSRLERTESVDYKLGTSCLNRNIPLVEGHRAVNDTRSNRDLVKSYLTSLRNMGSSETVKEEKPKVKFQL